MKNKTFELNHIYRSKDGFGCGYDASTWYTYYMPVRKSKSSIWVAELRISAEQWGSIIHSVEEADEIAKNALNNKYAVINRKTLRVDDDGYEYFIYKDEYEFAKYITEVF